MLSDKGNGQPPIEAVPVEAAVMGADIVTPAAADKQNATILADSMIGAGVHINAVSGDCPGKTELHRNILLRPDIFVKLLRRAASRGISSNSRDHPVAERWQVMTGAVPGRQSAD